MNAKLKPLHVESPTERAPLDRAGASVYGSAHRAVVERLPRRAAGRDLPPVA